MRDNGQTKKLHRHGLSRDVARKLVEAGYYTPRLIKAASDKELLGIPSIGKSAVEDIRGAIG